MWVMCDDIKDDNCSEFLGLLYLELGTVSTGPIQCIVVGYKLPVRTRHHGYGACVCPLTRVHLVRTLDKIRVPLNINK